MKLVDLERANRLLKAIASYQKQLFSYCYDNESKQFFREQIVKCYEEIKKM